jgi:hypothetical protein
MSCRVEYCSIYSVLLCVVLEYSINMSIIIPGTLYVYRYVQLIEKRYLNIGLEYEGSVGVPTMDAGKTPSSSTFGSPKIQSFLVLGSYPATHKKKCDSPPKVSQTIHTQRGRVRARFVRATTYLLSCSNSSLAHAQRRAHTRVDYR